MCGGTSGTHVKDIRLFLSAVMAPLNSTLEQNLSNVKHGKIVISGMSGLFPLANNVAEFQYNLYNKKNPICSPTTRWKYDHPELSQYVGNIDGIDRFDAQFFGIHYRLGTKMDAMARKLLEQAYQAIFDAGLSPEHLNEEQVGVYVGCYISETEKALAYDYKTKTDFGMVGCSKTMFANRISYWLNSKGPSMAIDAEGCSSTVALEMAYQDINRGVINSAIVGGCNLCLHPQTVIHYGRAIMISKDGKTRSFDENACGCAKSEAINVLFIQRAEHALRIYAELKYVKCEFTSIEANGTDTQYGFYRKPEVMKKFLNNFYKKANVSPSAVEYIDAFGSATPRADIAELQAIDRFFCKNKQEPLLIGSVTSNVGYSNASHGISGIIKVLLGYHTGKLCGNLHLETPRQDVEALRDGRIRIITENEDFNQTYAALNCFSVTGVNSHVLLNGWCKPKDRNRYKSNIPYLVTISGRQESAIEKIFDELKRQAIDLEQLALLHHIHEKNIKGHLSRGFIILDTNEITEETVVVSEEIDYFDDMKRPLWFVYSGMGSQWTGMGQQLMRIPVFASAIKKCQRVLEPKGIDVVHIITSQDQTIFNNILNSFVGIAAIQIGLTDVLFDLGIIPDNIIGHSVGELGCGYADGCLTAEEMILAAYSRGKVSITTEFIQGSMAAVGMGYQQISKICPPDIEVACHNSAESCTISGPVDSMRAFVTKLTENNIFAKEVPCSNIAYHSKYIAEAGPSLLKHLKAVIESPKPRSKRWISTSVPQDKWEEPLAKFCSAEYHTNNLLSPVLFEESSQLIPDNAVLVEVAPHGLLQAILSRSLTKCINIPLTRRGNPDNVVFLMKAIGRLYQHGFIPKVKVLYPKIEFPVSTGTPMLSHLVEWSHAKKWPLTLYMPAAADRQTAAACNFILSIHDDEHNFYTGNIIRGKILYPFAAVLTAVWDTLAMFTNASKRQFSVRFREVHLYSQPVLHNTRQLHLSISLHRGTGWFEVMDEITKVATGYIYEDKPTTPTLVSEIKESMYLDSTEIYSQFANRGYLYKNDFQSIHKVSISLTEAELFWCNNWVTFLDSLIQLNDIKIQHNGVSQPSYIRSLTIDVESHSAIKSLDDGRRVMRANLLHDYGRTSCGGVTMEGIQFVHLPTLNKHKVALSALKFVPFTESKNTSNNNMDMRTTLQVYLQIVSENVNKDIINVVEILDYETSKNAAVEINRLSNVIPNVKLQYKSIYRNNILKGHFNMLKDIDLLLLNNLSSDEKICQSLHNILRSDTFLMNTEQDVNHGRSSSFYRVVCSHYFDSLNMELLRWGQCSLHHESTYITVRSQNDIDSLASVVANLKKHQKLLVLTLNEHWHLLKNLINVWRKASHQPRIHLLMMLNTFVNDDKIEKMSLDLVFNMVENETYGGKYYVDVQNTVNHTSPKSNVMLRNEQFGAIDSLQWVQIPTSKDAGITVKVHYAGLNYLDSKRAFGEIIFDGENDHLDHVYGMDFSGITEKGTRVMGLVKGGAVSSQVLAQPQLLWPVPEHWTLEDAATIPLAYCLAFYCMTIKNNSIFPGKRVFIHGGAGALGQAVISVALANGCEVFTTVSDVRKKHFLRRLFPNLQDDHIGNSRDHTFSDVVLNATDGHGCDLLITCVKGSLKNDTLRCCAHYGLVIDLVQIRTRENFYYGMSHMTKSRSYIAIDISSIFNTDNVKELRYLQQLVSDGIARGYVRPLSRVTYEPRDVSRALALLNHSRHRGRVLLRMHEASGIKAQHEINCSPDKCHIIVCDNEVFGAIIAERLVQRGAKKIQIICAGKTDLIDFKMRSWKKLQVELKAYSKALNENNISSIIKENQYLGPVEGIHISITNKYETMSETVRLTKILNELDMISRKICPSLIYFGILRADDNIGQDICMARAEHYLPATTLMCQVSQYSENEINARGSTNLAASDIINAYERSILSQEVVTKLHKDCIPQGTLLEQICEVADIKNIENINEQVTLFQLGLDVEKSQVVFTFLRNAFNITLAEDEVPFLTPKRIQEIENFFTEKKYEDTTGLTTFISYVDPDELEATTEMKFLPTRTTSTNMRNDEFGLTETHLCIIPGLEKHTTRYRLLCERLKLPAFILQSDSSRPQETIAETAQRYCDIILGKMSIRSHFYLLGYESGVLIALEMAAILEKTGLTGTVFCIGGEPSDIKILLKHYLPELNSEEPQKLEEAVMKHMITLMAGNSESEAIEKTLQSNIPWNEKMEVCIRMLRGRVKYSSQYMRNQIVTSIWRLMHTHNYKINLQPLSSKIVILKPTLNERLSVEIADASKGLQSLSKRSIAMHQLQAPLAYATYDLRCAGIVNHYLSDNILQDFEKRNLCDTYLLNAQAFVTKVDG